MRCDAWRHLTTAGDIIWLVCGRKGLRATVLLQRRSVVVSGATAQRCCTRLTETANRVSPITSFYNLSSGVYKRGALPPPLFVLTRSGYLPCSGKNEKKTWIFISMWVKTREKPFLGGFMEQILGKMPKKKFRALLGGSYFVIGR